MTGANEWGHTVQPQDGGGDVMHALAEADRPRHSDQTPGEWLKSNLFSSWYNGLITIVFGTVGIVLGFLFLRFLLINARWEPVRANLELFFVGRFPREERTRMIVQVLFVAGSAGMFAGWLRQRSHAQAELAGIDPPETSIRELIGSYWSVALFAVSSIAIGAGVDSFRPWVLFAGAILAGAAGFALTLRPRRGPAGVVLAIVPLVPFALAGGVLSLVPDLANGSAYLIATVTAIGLAVVQYLQRPAVTLSGAMLLGVAGFQVLSGTTGMAWVFLTIALLPAALDALDRLGDGAGSMSGIVGSLLFGGGVVFYVLFTGITPLRIIALAVGLGVALVTLVGALGGDSATGQRLGTVTVLALVTWYIGRLIGLDGIDWSSWGGLHLNIVIAAASITLAFPIGLLLALGRRSSLPVLRWLCTTYIELIRGVPLISLLLMAQLFVGFFLSSGQNNLTLTTKALIVITMFSSAYIAEIVRGGLQAVPKGQTEAGQAMGLSPAKITRLLVLPQALRAVIPSMVGQFISLFKDTSLLTIIGVQEFLGTREIVHTQEAFRGFGLVETLVFVAFGFWAISFTQSRESQRLERRLNVSN
ncbi:MAG: amino acid ABC transporter permease [Ilumatobacter sp.]